MARTPTRPPVSFYRLIQRIARLYGGKTAELWTKAVLGYQAHISEPALRSAIASGRISAIEAVVAPAALQSRIQKAIGPTILQTVQTAGTGAAQILRAKGIEVQFNAMHPNVVQWARDHAAEMVADVPEETKRIIAEVIARGAERGLPVVEQAKAIKEVIGLPPNWVQAPDNFAVELQSGKISAATGRRMPAALRREIEKRAKNDTLDDAFIQSAASQYTQALIEARAETIARTESIRAANQGLIQSWDQAQDAGDLPASTRVFWIVTPDDRLCEICVRIPDMNPAGRAVGESFTTPEGLVDAPPAPHPNCRCTLGLGF